MEAPTRHSSRFLFSLVIVSGLTISCSPGSHHLCWNCLQRLMAVVLFFSKVSMLSLDGSWRWDRPSLGEPDRHHAWRALHNISRVKTVLRPEGLALRGDVHSTLSSRAHSKLVVCDHFLLFQQCRNAHICDSICSTPPCSLGAD